MWRTRLCVSSAPEWAGAERHPYPSGPGQSVIRTRVGRGAGALFLGAGAILPLTVLPGPLQAIGLVLPVTWWIAGTREALLPGSPSSVGGDGSFFARIAGHAAPGPAEMVLALLVTGTVGTLAAVAAFRISDRRARRAGLYDRTTGS